MNTASASAIQSLSNNSLFIGDLSKFCSESELENLFIKYGQIIGNFNYLSPLYFIIKVNLQM